MTVEVSAELHTPNTDPCWSDAWTAYSRSEVTEREYYTLLLAHLQGLRHSGDDLVNETAREAARRIDVFPRSLRQIALGDSYEPVENIEPYIDLVESCSKGNLVRMQQIYNLLCGSPNNPDLLQPLAVLAACKGKTDVLQFCLVRGAIFDADLDEAISNCQHNTTTLELLWSYNWHNIRDSPTILNKLACQNIYRPALYFWLFDHGAEVDLRTYQGATLGPVSVPVMKTMVAKFGVDALRSTGSLQIAASCSDPSLVEYLLQIGLDPNEVAPPDIDIREPFYTALWEAGNGNSPEIVRVLLKYGATLDRPFNTRRKILAMALAHNDQNLVELIHSSP